jgi:hypothetical protein
MSEGIHHPHSAAEPLIYAINPLNLFRKEPEPAFFAQTSTTRQDRSPQRRRLLPRSCRKQPRFVHPENIGFDPRSVASRRRQQFVRSRHETKSCSVSSYVPSYHLFSSSQTKVSFYFSLNSSAPLCASMWTVWPSRTLPSRMSIESGSRISFWIVRRSGRAP